METIRYPKTPPICSKCKTPAQVEFWTGTPNFEVGIRIHCGCGTLDSSGRLHDKDTLLLVGAMAIKAHNRIDARDGT